MYYQQVTNNQNSNRNILKFILFILLTTFSLSFGQVKGIISGKIIDKSTNEDLIGASVLVVGTTTGAQTDLDGVYSIKGISPGKYQLKISYISYQTVVVNDVVVESGKVTTVNIQLEPVTTELNEVVVSAEALKSTEAAILNIQKNSLSIVDGVSAELIKKNNSSDGTDILKRMTGVTISEGKYAFIRGVSDRYNSTMLNGANLPSTDPEKKSFSYDLFPSSLIENIVTNKTASAYKRADFSGGLVQINTVEFPNKFLFEIGAGSSYNKISNLADAYTYSGGKYDFLGIDDGTRSLPSAVPNKVDGTLSQDKLQEIGRMFKNNWNTKNSQSPLNSNFKLSLGNSVELGEGILGYIASFTYSNEFSIKDYQRDYYNYEGIWYDYNGMDYNNKITWGGLLNISYKLSQDHKISLKNIYNQNSDNYVIYNEGVHSYVPEYRRATTLQFLSRSLYSSQLVGEHVFELFNKSIVNWNINYSVSKREEPDTRKYWYSRDIESNNEELRFSMNEATATRFFSTLDDKIFGFSFDITVKPFENPALPNFKAGMMFDKKDRSYVPRVFGFNFNRFNTPLAVRDSIFKLPVDQIFKTENISKNFITINEVSNPSDKYDANESVFGSYLMVNTSLLNFLKLTGGLRYEVSTTDMQFIDPSNYNKFVTVNPEYNDILPSLNASAIITEQFSIRGAYSRTLARPELRELAYSGYYDFLTDDYVYGNPQLKRTVIDNYDLKFEYYPSPMELYSVSLFYKYFENPIEIIGTNASIKTRTWKNADHAKTLGIEFEVRKKLAFLFSELKDLSFIGNLSFINSEVDLGTVAIAQAELEQNRPLQGQADFILNMGLYYDNYEAGLTANLIYNKVGTRIIQVGMDKSGDIVDSPRDLVDFNLSKKLFDSFTIKFAVKDLLSQNQKTIQKTFRFGDKVADNIKKSTSFSISISYQL